MILAETERRTATVALLDASQPADRAAWLALWTRWPTRDVMAHPDYVRLFARPGDRILAATLPRDGGGILYPVILRPLAREPWGSAAGRACDLTTPYGYGGPCAWNVTELEAREFWRGFDSWAADEGVVSSFARLSPFPDLLLPFEGRVATKSINIVRRLDLPADEIWADYAPKVRRNVQRARGRGVTVEADPGGERLDDFLEVYLATMKRRNASIEYYFPRRMFEDIFRDLAGHCSLYHAIREGRVISSELVLLSKRHAYSFLVGSTEEAFACRATDLLRHEVILACRAAGKRDLVLGGGFRGEDGVFRFKKSFAPGGERPFQVGQRIFDPALAGQLEEDRRRYELARGNDWWPAPGYFPVYRA